MLPRDMRLCVRPLGDQERHGDMNFPCEMPGYGVKDLTVLPMP